MRKLMSKKGFTLVELMIVVVILGILVAVAVPIFSAVTKNARTKTCASNIRIIKSNMSTYYMSGNDGDPFTTEQTGILTDSTFVGMFDGGLPKCPAGTGAYAVKAVFATGATSPTEFKVACPNWADGHHPAGAVEGTTIS